MNHAGTQATKSDRAKRIENVRFMGQVAAYVVTLNGGWLLALHTQHSVVFTVFDVLLRALFVGVVVMLLVSAVALPKE